MTLEKYFFDGRELSSAQGAIYMTLYEVMTAFPQVSSLDQVPRAIDARVTPGRMEALGWLVDICDPHFDEEAMVPAGDMAKAMVRYARINAPGPHTEDVDAGVGFAMRVIQPRGDYELSIPYRLCYRHRSWPPRKMWAPRWVGEATFRPAPWHIDTWTQYREENHEEIYEKLRKIDNVQY